MKKIRFYFIKFLGCHTSDSFTLPRANISNFESLVFVSVSEQNLTAHWNSKILPINPPTPNFKSSRMEDAAKRKQLPWQDISETKTKIPYSDRGKKVSGYILQKLTCHVRWVYFWNNDRRLQHNYRGGEGRTAAPETCIEGIFMFLLIPLVLLN